MMPPISIASESGSPLTRRDLNRVKKGLVNVSEHLREKLKRIKQALEEETEQRKQEAPTLRKLLEDRVDMLASAFHTALEVLREDINDTLNPLKDKVGELDGEAQVRC